MKSYRYMVVYQYGAAVLFNVEDHEVDYYLQAVRQHASGLLTEMRKDGQALLTIYNFSIGRDYYSKVFNCCNPNNFFCQKE